MSDLSKLFDEDPLKLTKEDISAIVARMRESQAQFELGIREPKAKKTPTKRSDLLKELGVLDE